MVKRPEYYEVISEAIDDLIEHGFTSAERVAYWEKRIKDAADRFLGSTAQVDELLRQMLASTYRKMIENGQIAKYHAGVARWTIDKVKPSLRAELDRRILASANLIKLNRQQAIAKTLQRFSGWSTSIPAGGTEVAKKREEKERIRKPLAQIKFEERRVVIDQGHKLIGALNNIVATDNGAIALRWRSNWRQPNYNYRIDHKERDQKIYGIRDSWAHREGLVKKPDAGWYDEITAVAVEPFCRCWGVYLYGLSDLPDEMLTVKGRERLAEARRKVREMA
jgi:hypothetical protein